MAALIFLFSAAAIVLRNFQQNNPFNRVTYADLVLPHRWGDVSRLRGESWIAYGKSRLEAGDPRLAMMFYRAGLARQPAGFEARADLARLYASSRLRVPAMKVLVGGFDYGYPNREYLRIASSLAAEADNPPEWLSLMRRVEALFLAQPPELQLAGDAEWIFGRIVEARIAMGDFEGAWDELIRRDLPNAEWREQRTRLLMHLKRPAAAIEEAVLWVAESPTEPSAYRSLARAHREAGDLAGMHVALKRLRDLDPRFLVHSFFALDQFYAAGLSDEASDLIDDLLFRHGANPALYGPLIQVLGASKAKDGIDRLERELIELGRSTHPVHWARLDLATEAQDWPAMRAAIAAIRTLPGPDLSASQTSWLVIADRLVTAVADSGPVPQSLLVESVSRIPASLRLFQRVIDGLIAAQRIETAASVLTLAEGPFPDSQTIARLRSTIDSRRAELRQSASKSAESTPTLQRWATIEEFYRDYDALDRAGTPDEALDLLMAARRSRADWVAAAADRLNATELPHRARLEDLPTVQFLARSTLSRGVLSSAVVLRMARDLIGQEKRAAATVLIKEVLRQSPDDAETEELLKSLTEEPTPDQAILE